MNETEELSREIKSIKQIMERSSRFISLSGLSGISAGICALLGAGFADSVISKNKLSIESGTSYKTNYLSVDEILKSSLVQIAVITFIAAFLLAFAFTYMRSKKDNIPVWGTAARRLMLSVSVPVAVGGFFLLALIRDGAFGYVAPGCLVFYGLGLVNAGKYTLPEIVFLGYAEIILGLINLVFIGHGLLFWSLGFGLLHILYGSFMWLKYERLEMKQ